MPNSEIIPGRPQRVDVVLRRVPTTNRTVNKRTVPLNTNADIASRSRLLARQQPGHHHPEDGDGESS
jgi:hypothetical protein